jgi:hypothetical protein
MKILKKVKKALEKIMKTASMSLEIETGCYIYEPVMPTPIDDGQTGITLTGTDFMEFGTILELCDSLTYSSATRNRNGGHNEKAS